MQIFTVSCDSIFKLKPFSPEGSLKLVELLIAKGADVNLKDESGISPLLAAINEGLNCFHIICKMIYYSG